MSYTTLELHESTPMWLHLLILIRLKAPDKPKSNVQLDLWIYHQYCWCDSLSWSCIGNMVRDCLFFSGLLIYIYIYIRWLTRVQQSCRSSNKWWIHISLFSFCCFHRQDCVSADPTERWARLCLPGCLHTLSACSFPQLAVCSLRIYRIYFFYL